MKRSDIIPLNTLAMAELNQGNHVKAAKILKDLTLGMRDLET